MTTTMVESVSWRRLRWRLKGAWQWPTFALLTVADAVLLMRLPFAGDGADVAGALLLATFFNLLAVALVAPFAGLALRRVRRDLPWAIARDYMGAVLVAGIFAALLVGGLGHRAARAAERADRRAVFAAVHAWVLAREPGMAGLAVDTVRMEEDRYRACVGYDEPLCLFVNTDQSPAGIIVDPARLPNVR